MNKELCSFEKKFIEMIRMRKYSSQTETGYLYHLRKFKEYKKGTHETRLSSQDINDYLVYLNTKDVSDSYFNQAINSIRFFFKYVLNKKIKDYLVVRPKKAKTSPIILNQEEVQAMFDNCDNLKHLAILSLFYSAGLRISEVINLKIADIDSNQMVIRITSGKGRKDRLVPLSPETLDILRNYYQEFKPVNYLFNGQKNFKGKDLEQYSASSIRQFINQIAFRAGINKDVWPHLLRHTKITHSLENGTDIHTEQIISGHSSIKTTIGYTHKSPKFIGSTPTPMQNIIFKNKLLKHESRLTI